MENTQWKRKNVLHDCPGLAYIIIDIPISYFNHYNS